MPIRLLGEKMSGRANQMWAICGVRLATTRDHVPPKAILVRPFPKNLITVPACVECNNGSAPMDSDFRVYLAAGVADNGVSANKLWKESSRATLRNNRKLLAKLSSTIGEAEIRTASGIELGRRTTYHWPAHVFNSVIERIVRGLYFHHYHEILGPRVMCTVGFRLSLPAELIAATSNWHQYNVGDALVYRFGRAVESPLNSLWILQFYGGLWASFETTPLFND